MGRSRLHTSGNAKVRVWRQNKLKSSENKTFCSVCNDDIICTGDAEIALIKHGNSSAKHKRLLLGVKTIPTSSVAAPIPMYWADDNDDGSTLPRNLSNKLPTSAVQFQESDNVLMMLDDTEEFSMEEDVVLCGAVVAAVPTERELLLVNTSLPYGRKSAYHLKESAILTIQDILLEGFDKIVTGLSPYGFSKVKNRDVDWVSALEVTRDFIVVLFLHYCLRAE